MSEETKGKILIKTGPEPKTVLFRKFMLVEPVVVKTEQGDEVTIPAGTVLKVSEPVW